MYISGLNLGLILVAALALGMLIGWLSTNRTKRICKNRDALGWVFMPTYYRHWSYQDKALEALEGLSSLRRAAAAMPDKKKSPSFRQSLARLEHGFQSAWQDYKDGHIEEATNTANEAYREFR